MNTQIEISDIQLLHLLHHHGSISKVAETMHLSQSACSRRLQVVEEKLGASLFTRTTRSVKITPTGQTFLKETASVPNLINSAVQNLQEEILGVSKKITIALSSSLCAAHIPGLIRPPSEQHPLKIVLLQQSRKHILHSLLTHRVDLAILPNSHDLSPHATIHHHMQDAFSLILPATSPSPSMKHFAKWAAKQSWILPEANDITHHQILGWLRSHKIDINPSMELPQFDLICQLVAIGHGVAIVPQRALKMCHQRKKIKSINLTPSLTRELVVASPKNAPLSPKIQSYIDSILFS